MKKIYKKILLQKNSSNSKILTTLSRNKFKTVIFLNKKKLYGIISDGDLRKKFFFKKKNLKIKNLINKKPTYFKINFNKKKALELMKKKRLIIAPIVDKANNLVGILDYYRSSGNNVYDFEAIIMAGGKGKRLAPLTNNIPKPMLRFHNKPIISYPIKQLEKYGVKKIFVSVNYKKKHFEKFFKNKINIKLIKEKKFLGTAGPLNLIKKELVYDNLIISNGDVITNINYNNLLKFHNQLNSDLTVCVKEFKQRIQYGIMKFKGSLLTEFLEKPTTSYHVNAGIYVVKKNLINLVIKNKKFDMNDLIDISQKRNKKIAIFPLYEDWVDVGTKENFLNLKKKYWINKI